MKSNVPTPRYSRNEELASSISHGLGIVLSLAGLVTLVYLAVHHAPGRAVVGGAIFGLTLVLTYTASTLYHATTSARAKQVLRLLDHGSIYLLIAGTYTPLALLSLPGAIGWALLATIWSLAALGVALTVLARHRFKVLEIVLYLVMGWMVIVVVKPLAAALGRTGLWLVLGGGVVYTLGLGFYGWRRLRYHHLVWHLFVLAGSVLHFFAVLGATLA